MLLMDGKIVLENVGPTVGPTSALSDRVTKAVVLKIFIVSDNRWEGVKTEKVALTCIFSVVCLSVVLSSMLPFPSFRSLSPVTSLLSKAYKNKREP